MAKERGREEKRRRGREWREEEGRGDVSTYLLSFCCDAQVGTSDTIWLIWIDNVYLRANKCRYAKVLMGTDEITLFMTSIPLL